MNDYPCHSRPFSQWCDHAGPGGFMGHTCQNQDKPEKPKMTASYRERLRAVIRRQRGRIIELQLWLNQADELARRNWALFCNANRKPATNYYNQEQKQMTEIEGLQALYSLAQQVITTQATVIQLRDEQIAELRRLACNHLPLKQQMEGMTVEIEQLRGECANQAEHIKILQADTDKHLRFLDTAHVQLTVQEGRCSELEKMLEKSNNELIAAEEKNTSLSQTASHYHDALTMARNKIHTCPTCGNVFTGNTFLDRIKGI